MLIARYDRNYATHLWLKPQVIRFKPVETGSKTAVLSKIW